ncbi:MAG: CDGSH iron-sulfur domain-containing protein [Thermoplasma acidophilum]|nr:CDGSH iron-sulfur domain-containing protein [Thermoplasma acidophilum]
MARLVLHTRDHPYAIKVGDKEVHICGCGLSSHKPYCDGTHKITADEGDRIYIYNAEKKREEFHSFYDNE